MGFFEKLKMALKKIKGKIIVATVLIIAVLLWGIAPFTVAINVAWVPVIDQETQEFVRENDGSIKEQFDWSVFFEALLGVDEEGKELIQETEDGKKIGYGLRNPIGSVSRCFTEFFGSYMYVCKWFVIFYGTFVLVGVIKAFPKHEYENIENGSSDWSEGGEQYKVLSEKKGIVLAEKNYLPVDKRGNVNVLVVRRFWCW